MTNAQIAAFITSYIAADEATREEMDLELDGLVCTPDDAIDSTEIEGDSLVIFFESGKVLVIGTDGSMEVA